MKLEKDDLQVALWLLTDSRLPIKNDLAYLIKKDTSLYQLVSFNVAPIQMNPLSFPLLP
jgi:hypothetical protein